MPYLACSNLFPNSSRCTQSAKGVVCCGQSAFARGEHRWSESAGRNGDSDASRMVGRQDDWLRIEMKSLLIFVYAYVRETVALRSDVFCKTPLNAQFQAYYIP